MIEWLAYSERGVVWSVFAEIAKRETGCAILDELLALAGIARAPVTQAQVLVDQAFSGFGRADVVLLLDHADEQTPRSCVVIAAKVRRQLASWSPRNELTRHLLAHVARKPSFANLFVQLYAKQVLVTALRTSSLDASGAPFLAHHAPRRLGTSAGLVAIIERMTPYLAEAAYVALLPNDRAFAAVVADFAATHAITCDEWRSLTWPVIEALCARHAMTDALAVFAHNDGQIY